MMASTNKQRRAQNCDVLLVLHILAKMSFDKISDLTAGVYFDFYNNIPEYYVQLMVLAARSRDRIDRSSTFDTEFVSTSTNGNVFALGTALDDWSHSTHVGEQLSTGQHRARLRV